MEGDCQHLPKTIGVARALANRQHDRALRAALVCDVCDVIDFVVAHTAVGGAGRGVSGARFYYFS